MKGVIYARYSSDNQREESIEGQIRENMAYAERNGIEIVGTYIDRAYSARTDRRPDFQRMIKDSAKKNFDVVIVWKLDRFARNRFDSAKYKAALKKNDVKVISATEAISDDPVGILVEGMLESNAEYYSAELSQKVNRGLTENALKCIFNGGTIPYGYCIDEEQHYQIDPVQAPVVQEMFLRYAGGETMTEIVEDLNARGLRTAAGNRFNKNSLTRIFSNRKYIGEYRYKDIVFPDAMPAIVTKELFERVSARLKSNKHATGKSKAPERYLLTTKLFCGTCKCMLVGDSANKPNGVIYRYYKCAGAKRHECDRKAVRKDWIEDKVVELVASIIHNEENLCHIADELMVLLSKGSELIPVLEAQLKEVRKSIRNMMRAIEQGITTRNTKAHLLELEAEEDRLVANIQAEEEKLPKISREMILFALHRFSNLNLSIAKNKERLIDGMVKAILLYDDRIVVYLTFKDEPLTIPTADELRDMENSSDIDAAVSATLSWVE